MCITWAAAEPERLEPLPELRAAAVARLEPEAREQRQAPVELGGVPEQPHWARRQALAAPEA